MYQNHTVSNWKIEITAEFKINNYCGENNSDLFKTNLNYIIEVQTKGNKYRRSGTHL